MKKKISLAFFIICLIYLDQGITSLNAVKQNEPDSTGSLEKYEKEKRKLERNLKKMKHEMEKYKASAETLEKTNNEIKKELTLKNNQITKINKQLADAKNNNSGDVSSFKNIKDILTHMGEFHTLFNQMQLTNLEDKELKEDIDSKLKDMSYSQQRVDDIYRDLKSTYKDRIVNIIEKLNRLQKNEKNIRQKLLIVEKEKEKVSSARVKLYRDHSSNLQVIEPECVNRGTCRTCLENPKCIYCSKSKRCMLGDLSGAYDGSCNNENDFRYSSCENVSFCNKYKNCTECINNASCGWCAETKMCLEGTRNNPIGIICINGYFHKFAQGRCSTHASLNNFLN